LLHAYSARNAGDGLLVDLSLALLREAFGPQTRVSIMAADPESFSPVWISILHQCSLTPESRGLPLLRLPCFLCRSIHH
jgi:hypothetical protein